MKMDDIFKKSRTYVVTENGGCLSYCGMTDYMIGSTFCQYDCPHNNPHIAKRTYREGVVDLGFYCTKHQKSYRKIVVEIKEN